MTPSLKNSNGFTLLELILSLAILGFIIGISLQGIRLGIAARDQGEQKADTFQRFRIIQEQLTQKITSVYPVFVVSPEEYRNSAASKTSAPRRILAFEGKPDSLRLVTFATPLTATDGSAWAHEVQFYVGTHPVTRERGIIMMERDTTDGGVFDEFNSQSSKAQYFLLAKGVSRIKFRYYQVKKVSLNGNGIEEKESVAFKGNWVDEIHFELPSDTGGPPRNSTDNQAGIPEAKFTLPRGVAISLGIIETQVPGKNEAPRTVLLPPIIIPLHSGMEFTLPVMKNETA
ncbi:MAG: type II secretion system protein J [Nitrospinaceae bacterium]